jgi:transposase
MRPKGSAAVIEDRRRRALKLLDAGLSLHEVARRIGCAPSSAMRWRDVRARGGDPALKVRTSPGRPPRLTARQKKQLIRQLLRGPAAHGYNTQLWTTARIAEVISERFGVRYHRAHVGRLMHALDWSCL